jgi:hypothetical protein
MCDERSKWISQVRCHEMNPCVAATGIEEIFVIRELQFHPTVLSFVSDKYFHRNLKRNDRYKA